MKTTTKAQYSSQRIDLLSQDIQSRLNDSIQEIQIVNDDIHVLSINAKIQAARAGHAGAGFSVVASEVSKLVTRTQSITSTLRDGIENTLEQLVSLNQSVRGDRISQAAASAIDVVDRNLYERSCDVRWWATESAVISALNNPTPESIHYVSQRFGTILDSYTVYFDILLCDTRGQVLANGRPEKYGTANLTMTDRPWFQQAIHSSSGNEYGFEGVHQASLASNEPVLVYSCSVRPQGESQGPILGVLGVVFNWKGLGDIIAQKTKTALAKETPQPVECHLCYPDGTIISSTDPQLFLTKPQWIQTNHMLNHETGFQLLQAPDNKTLLVGYAPSPGFETYKSGWYALVTEETA